MRIKLRVYPEGRGKFQIVKLVNSGSNPFCSTCTSQVLFSVVLPFPKGTGHYLLGEGKRGFGRNLATIVALKSKGLVTVVNGHGTHSGKRKCGGLLHPYVSA